MKYTFLLKDVTDMETVRLGIDLVTKNLKLIGIDFRHDFKNYNGQLVSYSDKYIDTAGNEIKFTLLKPTFPENHCLIYDWTKATPQPTNPANHGKKIQLPIQFYYEHESVFLMYFLHELCHDLRPDLAHNQYLNPQWSQKPPTDYYLYLLKTYYKELVSTNPQPIVKKWGLKPKVNRLAEAFIAECKKQGELVKITEGYRSIERQNELYAQGRTKPGKIVTNVKGGSSYHNYGVSFDVCFTKTGYEGNWSKIGKIGQSLGLEWGGGWLSFKDRPHFQFTAGYKLKSFQQNTIDWKKFD